MASSPVANGGLWRKPYEVRGSTNRNMFRRCWLVSAQNSSKPDTSSSYCCAWGGHF